MSSKVLSKSVSYINAVIRGGYFVDDPREDVWLEVETWDDVTELNMTWHEAVALCSVVLSALIDKYAHDVARKEAERE